SAREQAQVRLTLVAGNGDRAARLVHESKPFVPFDDANRQARDRRRHAVDRRDVVGAVAVRERGGRKQRRERARHRECQDPHALRLQLSPSTASSASSPAAAPTPASASVRPSLPPFELDAVASAPPAGAPTVGCDCAPPLRPASVSSAVADSEIFTVAAGVSLDGAPIQKTSLPSL